jgi:hypothetical protein
MEKSIPGASGTVEFGWNVAELVTAAMLGVCANANPLHMTRIDKDQSRFIKYP